MQTTVKVRAAPDQHIDRGVDVPEDAVHFFGLNNVLRCLIWDHHHQVVVAIRVGSTARRGTEQVDSLRAVEIHQPPDDLSQDGIVRRERLNRHRLDVAHGFAPRRNTIPVCHNPPRPARACSPLCPNPISFPINLLAPLIPALPAPSCYSLSGETTPHPRRSRICDASRLSTRPGCVTEAPIQGHFLLVFSNLPGCTQNARPPPRDASQTSHSSSVRPGCRLRYHRTLWPSPKPLCQPGAIW